MMRDLDELRDILQRRVHTLEREFAAYGASADAGERVAATAVAGGIMELAALALHVGIPALDTNTVEVEFTAEELAAYPGSRMFPG